MDENQNMRTYDEDEIDLLDLLLVLARNKGLICGLTSVFAIVAVVVSLLMTPVYTATTHLIPPQTSQASALSRLGALSGLAGGALGIQTPADLLVGIIKSRTVVDGIIDKFDLKAVYEAETMTAVRSAVSNSLQASVDGKSGIISVSYQDKDPQMAADIANAFVGSLQDIMKSLAVTEAGQQRLFLESQLKDVQLNLLRAENALTEYQKASGLLNVGGQATALMEALAKFRAQISAKEVALKTARTFATANNPEVQRLVAEISGLREQLVKLEEDAGAENSLSLEELPDAGLEYARLLRDVKFNETLYELLIKQYESARMAEAQEPTIIQVVDQAIAPENRTKPNRKLMVVLATVLGFFLSIFMSFVREFARNASADPERASKMQALKHHLSFRRKPGTLPQESKLHREVLDSSGLQ